MWCVHSYIVYSVMMFAAATSTGVESAPVIINVARGGAKFSGPVKIHTIILY